MGNCFDVESTTPIGIWNVLFGPADGAAVRCLTQSGNMMIGPRVAGRAGHMRVEVWASEDQGASWRVGGIVATSWSESVLYGEPVLLGLPDSLTVFCAFREEHIIDNDTNAFQLTLYRSDNGGSTWRFDSTITGPFQGSAVEPENFVGAPFLHLEGNMLQCYFDNEPEPNRQGFRHHQWITMLSRNISSSDEWDPGNLVIASREYSSTSLSRDGMSSIVSLEQGKLFCITEGVSTEPPHSNVVRCVRSLDGGQSWDMETRRIVYQGRWDPKSSSHFNAYCPWGIRVASSEVWVAFLTDEDFRSPPDLSSTGVGERRSIVKVVKSTTHCASWSEAEIILGGPHTQYYAPGLLQCENLGVLCAVDLLDSTQQVLQCR